MKTERQVREACQREAESAARRTLDRLMGATVDAMIGLISLDEIMTKYYGENTPTPYDWDGRNDLTDGDVRLVREYLGYIYARERLPI